MDNNIPQDNTGMPSTPVAAESGNGMKVMVAVIVVIALALLGWYFMPGANEMVTPPVEQAPTTSSVPSENGVGSAVTPAGVSTGASGATTVESDMGDVNAIEADMNNINSNTDDLDTSDIQ
jgi:hypothetical protein